MPFLSTKTTSLPFQKLFCALQVFDYQDDVSRAYQVKIVPKGFLKIGSGNDFQKCFFL